MGTNYYLEEVAGDKRGHPVGRRHIGKSSAGWCFALHVIPEDGIHDLPDWEREWGRSGTWIVDESGKEVTPGWLRDNITDRRWHKTERRTQRWLAENHAEDGPNGLARHCLAEGHCTGHGAGTWDLIMGEFS